jgi:polysaccharide pyruvyl transferase WcaK-like protein
MRVLILWADERSANLGVRALAQGTATMAREVWGNEITIDFQDLAANADGFTVSMELIKKDIRQRKGPIKAWLRQYDRVIDTGAGDSFTDIYGPQRIRRMLYTQITARRLGIPVVMGPQTIGPFSTLSSKLFARISLARMAVVAARDTSSAGYAKRLGRRAVVRATDVVFALPQPDVERDRDVVINVSGLLWARNPHVDPVTYQASVRNLIDEMLQRGRRVTLLAHVIDNPSLDNDTIPIRVLAAEYSDRLDTVIPTTLREVREVVAAANVVLGSRMHACLNALSVGTPAIPWAYSRKFAPLMADIGWNHSIDLRGDGDPVAKTFSILDQESEAGLRGQVTALRLETDIRTRAFATALAAV